MDTQNKIVTNFGAKGDGITDNSLVFQKLIDEINDNGGGKITIPAGTFLTGSLSLCSNLTLEIGDGAELKFINDPSLYKPVLSRWEGASGLIHQACLYGTNISNISIEGHGTINGNGEFWWNAFKSKSLDLPRPYLISIENSQNITLKSVTLLNSPSWTIHPLECSGVLIDGVTVRNPYDSPNTDGLDPESCENIKIVNCLFDVGDDCIAIKSGTEATEIKSSCKNIVISNCNMEHGHGGVVLGSEMSGNINGVVINNCTFNNTDRGIRMKTRRGRGGKISEIIVSNIVMNNVLVPIAINSYYFCGPSGKEKYVWDKSTYPVDSRTPQYEHLSFSNIIAKNVKSAAMFIYGLPEMPIKNLSISSTQIYMDQSSKPTEPEMIADAPKLSQAGIFIANTENAQLNNIKVYGTNDDLFNYNDSNNNLSRN